MAASVLIISYHFYPDRAVGAKRMSELARHLVRRGVRVLVITAATDPAATDPALLERVQGVELHHVAVPPKLSPALLGLIRRFRASGKAAGNAPRPVAEEPRRETWMGRLKRWYYSLEWLVDDRKLWSCLAAAKAWRLGLRQPFSCVISSGPPMSPHLAALLARPALRVPWIMDMRDPWRDDSEWMGHVHSGLSRRLNAAFEQRCVSTADQILTTSPGLADILRQRYPDRRDLIEVVYNGFDGSVTDAEPVPTGSLRLLYAGTLYYNRNPFPLLEALAQLLESPDVDRDRVSFVLVGHCESWQGRSVRDWVEANGLADRVEIRPPVSSREVGELMAEANVLVNFAQGQPQQIPAKMFDYIASGREMLLLTEEDSDSARLARATNAGEVVDPRHPEQVAQALLRLYRRYVLDGAGYRMQPEVIREYSRERQNERLVSVIRARGGRIPAAEAE